jgi:hypothetical protein
LWPESKCEIEIVSEKSAGTHGSGASWEDDTGNESGKNQKVSALPPVTDLG